MIVAALPQIGFDFDANDLTNEVFNIIIRTWFQISKLLCTLETRLKYLKYVQTYFITFLSLFEERNVKERVLGMLATIKQYQIKISHDTHNIHHFEVLKQKHMDSNPPHLTFGHILEYKKFKFVGGWLKVTQDYYPMVQESIRTGGDVLNDPQVNSYFNSGREGYMPLIQNSLDLR